MTFRVGRGTVRALRVVDDDAAPASTTASGPGGGGAGGGAGGGGWLVVLCSNDIASLGGAPGAADADFVKAYRIHALVKFARDV